MFQFLRILISSEIDEGGLVIIKVYIECKI